MDAGQLLSRVAETYARLNTLTVDMVQRDEPVDDDMGSRIEQRARCWFAAPDKVRAEHGGRRGSVMVTDGTELHTYVPMSQKYFRTAVPPLDSLPGCFRPEFPFAGGPVFLFARVSQNVQAARLLPDERDCHAVLVTYTATPDSHIPISGSVMTFWIDAHTNLVSRTEIVITHRWPEHPEPDTRKQITIFTRSVIDDEIPAAMFDFVPPAGVTEDSSTLGLRCGIGGGGGSRFRSTHGSNSVEGSQSYDWDGAVFIERERLKLRSAELTLDRRFTFSKDGTELTMTERVSACGTAAEHDFRITMG